MSTANVIVLPEGLRNLRYFFGGVARDSCRALEAEQGARLVAGFDYAVGEQGELGFGREQEGGLGVSRIGGEAERKAIFELKFLTSEIRGIIWISPTVAQIPVRLVLIWATPSAPARLPCSP